jgi:protein-tyrosine phosphatase
VPGIDDGARDLSVSLEMARAFVAQGVVCVACTPHILPGLYHNTGPEIRAAVGRLQAALDGEGIALHLVAGADNHVVPDFVEGLRSGHLLPIGDSPYVLVEPPHHVAPARMEDMFFSILVAGYSPILTHPERLTWIEQRYDMVRDLAARGVLMQITSGSLRGGFGRRPKYWAEKMICEGIAHVLATDAHDAETRYPDLDEGRRLAERLVGAEEAHRLVVTRPHGILLSKPRNDLPPPSGKDALREVREHDTASAETGRDRPGGLAGRLRRLFSR